MQKICSLYGIKGIFIRFIFAFLCYGVAYNNCKEWTADYLQDEWSLYESGTSYNIRLGEDPASYNVTCEGREEELNTLKNIYGAFMMFIALSCYKISVAFFMLITTSALREKGTDGTRNLGY